MQNIASDRNIVRSPRHDLFGWSILFAMDKKPDDYNDVLGDTTKVHDRIALDRGGVVRQCVALMRITFVVFMVYLKFKARDWYTNRHNKLPRG
jgi:hypothetical protein